MTRNRHLRCPHCSSTDTKKNGHHRGKHRYYCKTCGGYFTDKRAEVSMKNKEVWFKQWIVGKRTFEQLVHESPYSERTLKRYFYRMLPKCPVWHIQRREKVNLLIDGTYFPNKVCLVLYRDANIRMTIFYRLTDGERFQELKEDLLNIKQMGVCIESVTCDGGANILKAVREVCPEAVIQRCTVHIAREVETWITRKPQSEAGKELLELVRLLLKIDYQESGQLWLRAFIDWYWKYEPYINEKSIDDDTGRWWFTHKMLHRSVTHIKRAIPYLFTYTRYDNVPKTSNSIESFFGHLKDNLRIHRGLSNEHMKDFVKWYLFYKSNQEKLTKTGEKN